LADLHAGQRERAVADGHVGCALTRLHLARGPVLANVLE
jgi:hypothetical protein